MRSIPAIESLMQSSAEWTIHDTVQWAELILAEAGVEESRLNAGLLLAHVLQIDRSRMLVDRDRLLDAQVLSKFQSLVQRRAAREPLQYILGETEFMGLPFLVDTSVLIPRPETEILVEKGLEAIREIARTPMRILDIGTGCGNIAISLSYYSPGVSVTAIDISADALNTAGKNLERHRVPGVALVHADLFAGFLPGARFEMVVSNPPYVSLEEFPSLQPEIRLFEPRIATTDEADGLRFLRRILVFAKERLADGGALLVELAHDQENDAKRMATEHGFTNVTVHPDISGVPRVLEVWRERSEAVARP